MDFSRVSIGYRYFTAFSIVFFFLFLPFFVLQSIFLKVFFFVGSAKNPVKTSTGHPGLGVKHGIGITLNTEFKRVKHSSTAEAELHMWLILKSCGEE